MLLSPVCLPSSKSELYEDVKAIATGWGATAAGHPLSDVLREVVLKVTTARGVLVYKRRRES